MTFEVLFRRLLLTEELTETQSQPQIQRTWNMEFLDGAWARIELLTTWFWLNVPNDVKTITIMRKGREIDVSPVTFCVFQSQRDHYIELIWII